MPFAAKGKESMVEFPNGEAGRDTRCQCWVRGAGECEISNIEHRPEMIGMKQISNIEVECKEYRMLEMQEVNA